MQRDPLRDPLRHRRRPKLCAGNQGSTVHPHPPRDAQPGAAPAGAGAAARAQVPGPGRRRVGRAVQLRPGLHAHRLPHGACVPHSRVELHLPGRLGGAGTARPGACHASQCKSMRVRDTVLRSPSPPLHASVPRPAAPLTLPPAWRARFYSHGHVYMSASGPSPQTGKRARAREQLRPSYCPRSSPRRARVRRCNAAGGAARGAARRDAGPGPALPPLPGALRLCLQPLHARRVGGARRRGAPQRRQHLHQQ